MNFNKKYAKYKEYFEKSLSDFLDNYFFEDNVLNQAVKYAVVDGGKRVRPTLLFATAEMLGVPLGEVKNISLAIEMIHSYSLVHDDLPCMDNDDYRRGKLSTHKKFGENIGVLAGDALLNLAFEVALSKDCFGIVDGIALKLLAEYAGAKGMIKGQVKDLLSEKDSTAGEEDLLSIHYNKTAKLIAAPILIASIYSGYSHYDKLKEFAFNLGYLFQIVDDIMDCEGNLENMGKSPNKDASVDKLTSVKIYGLEGAKVLADKYYEDCTTILKELPNSEFLLEFTDYMLKRRV